MPAGVASGATRLWTLDFHTARRQSSPLCIQQQEAFEKCWAHSPLRAATRHLFYIAIHQVLLLSHAATVARRLRASMSTTSTTTTTTITRNTGDRYGPMEWAQSPNMLLVTDHHLGPICITWFHSHDMFHKILIKLVPGHHKHNK